MSIQDGWGKINPKQEIPDIETVSFNEKGEIVEDSIIRKFFLIFLIILLSGASFGLGRLSNKDLKAGIKIEYDSSLNTSGGLPSATSSTQDTKETQVPNPTTSQNTASVVGSVKGTKYHYLHCAGARQISEANKITFPDATAAETAGYTLALNCRPR